MGNQVSSFYTKSKKTCKWENIKSCTCCVCCNNDEEEVNLPAVPNRMDLMENLPYIDETGKTIFPSHFSLDCRMLMGFKLIKFGR